MSGAAGHDHTQADTVPRALKPGYSALPEGRDWTPGAARFNIRSLAFSTRANQFALGHAEAP